MTTPSRKHLLSAVFVLLSLNSSALFAASQETREDTNQARAMNPVQTMADAMAEAMADMEKEISPSYGIPTPQSDDKESREEEWETLSGTATRLQEELDIFKNIAKIKEEEEVLNTKILKANFTLDDLENKDVSKAVNPLDLIGSFVETASHVLSKPSPMDTQPSSEDDRQDLSAEILEHLSQLGNRISDAYDHLFKLESEKTALKIKESTFTKKLSRLKILDPLESGKMDLRSTVSNAASTASAFLGNVFNMASQAVSSITPLSSSTSGSTSLRSTPSPKNGDNT